MFYPDNCKLSNVLSGIANAAQRGVKPFLRKGRQPFFSGDSVHSVLATKKAGIKPAILILWDVLESPKGMPVAEPTTSCLSSDRFRRELSRTLLVPVQPFSVRWI
jgi:hypothetical protein